MRNITLRPGESITVGGTTVLSADTSALCDCLALLEHFLELSLEVRKRFLGLGDALAQTRSVNVGDGTAAACEVRVFLEPSDGLRELLAACLAGDFDGL